MSICGKIWMNIKSGVRMSHSLSRCIQFDKNGPPKEVLNLRTIQVNNDISPNQVLVKWLASPINPLDINKIEGNYPVEQEFPVIAGSEGTGIVEKVGRDVKFLNPGDSVVALGSGVPIWTEYAVIEDDKLMKIDKQVDLLSAATLVINPPTAYTMLKDYDPSLSTGDFVIQNAANSGLGRAVIQLAKVFELKTINLIRDRPNVQDLKNELRHLGADFVFTEDEFRGDGKKFIAGLGKPVRLAMNGVGGRSCLSITSALSPGGTVITYGGMSKRPHEISTSSFVFKNIKAVGCVAGWLKHGSREKFNAMFEHIQKLCIEGRLKTPPIETSEMASYEEAMRRAIEGKYGKQVLLLHPDSVELKNKI